MKILSLFGFFAASIMLSFSAFGQVPTPQILVTTSCNLNDGVSLDEAVEWFRANPRAMETSGPAFVRRPIVANSNFMDNYDFRIARYYPSYRAWISGAEARLARTGSRSRPTPLARDVFSCNSATQSMSHIRNVPGGDAFDGDVTLMTSRFCSLNEGSSVADAYSYVAEVAANFRSGGNNALMQVSTRQFKPVQNVDRGRAVVVTSVAATAENMGERLDLTRSGLNVTPDMDGVMSCGFSTVWRTHAIYRPNN